MTAPAVTLRAVRCAPVYLAPLGSTLPCPIKDWTVRISMPDSRRWVAKQCLKGQSLNPEFKLSSLRLIQVSRTDPGGDVVGSVTAASAATPIGMNIMTGTATSFAISRFRLVFISFVWPNDEAWHPLPGAPLRFRLRFVTPLRLRLGAGSGLPSAGLFCCLFWENWGPCHQLGHLFRYWRNVKPIRLHVLR